MWTAASRRKKGAGVERWEEPLHPGPQGAFYPTFSHDATPIPHISPPSDTEAVANAENPAWALGSWRWETPVVDPARERRTGCRTGARKRDCAIVAIPSAACASGGRAWEALTPRPDRRPGAADAPTIRPMATSLLPRCAAAFAAVAAVVLPLAGCGGASSSAGGDPGVDPAAFVPASAPAYVEAQIQPDGELGANARS